MHHPNECPISNQTPAEEALNVATHAVATVLAVVGAMVLVQAAWRHGTLLHVGTSALFGASWILLYTTSTLYHACRCVRRKFRLKVIDHCAIFVCIAGSYGPFVTHVVGGWQGYGVWALVWLFALGGCLYKWRSDNRYSAYSVAAYTLQGWLITVLFPQLWARLSFGAIALMWAAALAFSVGTAFYVRRAMLYNHAIWHCFVVLGNLFVYLCVFCYIVPGAR